MPSHDNYSETIRDCNVLARRGARGLEPAGSPVFLSRVTSGTLGRGIRAGLVAAATTAGALSGYGLRRGDWASAFASLGSNMLGSLGAAGPARVLAVATGGSVHVLAMIAWGLCLAVLSSRRSSVLAAGSALVVPLFAAFVLAPVFGPALGALRYGGLPPAHTWLGLGLMAAGLMAGWMMSEDRSGGQNAG